jgi:hypothetical protein
MSDIMPMGRVMGDLVHLPDGSILLINGAGAGMAGWDKGRDPTFQALLYLPNAAAGSRWKPLNRTTIPRLYHSTALLLPDGRVMVAGSAPNDPTSFSDASFKTERRVEYYYPPYLTSGRERPAILEMSRSDWTAYNTTLSILITVEPTCTANPDELVQFSVIQPGFRTHSTGHGQRMVWLTSQVIPGHYGADTLCFVLVTPPTPEVAPPGWYLLFANCDGIPSVAQWVQIGGDPAKFSV